MKNQDVSKKYTIIVFLLALVVVGSIVLMIQNRSIQSQQSQASSFESPEGIITVLGPNGGETFTPGQTVEIYWSQDDELTKLPVERTVYIDVVSMRAQSVGYPPVITTKYSIAQNVMSQIGEKNLYIWQIPEDYPVSAMGSDLGIKIGTHEFIGGRQHYDHSNDHLTITQGK